MSPLLIAYLNHDQLTMEELLQSGQVDVDDWDNEECRGPPLLRAVMDSRYSAARLLLKYGADPNKGYPAPLFMACHSFPMCKLLVEHGADTTAREVWRKRGFCDRFIYRLSTFFGGERDQPIVASCPSLWADTFETFKYFCWKGAETPRGRSDELFKIFSRQYSGVFIQDFREYIRPERARLRKTMIMLISHCRRHKHSLPFELLRLVWGMLSQSNIHH
jgi:hypothetical protein